MKLTPEELLRRYAEGERCFRGAVIGCRAQALAIHLDQADLRGIDLSEAELCGVSMASINLSGANLKRARLDHAFVMTAEFVETDFTEADLSWADFQASDLRHACLRYADLRNAMFSGADLRGADLTGANILGTDFGGAIMTDAIMPERWHATQYMPEKEWLVCTDPTPMLRFLLGTSQPRVQDIELFPACIGSDRKLRLFACACYYRVSHLLPDERARVAVEVAEQFADGLLPHEERERAEAHVRQPLLALEEQWRASRGAERQMLMPTNAALALGGVILWREAEKAAYYAASNAHLSVAELENPSAASSSSEVYARQKAEEQAQAEVVRCIFGNPFRPITIDPASLTWQDATVVKLAEAIYQERAFDRMPILADSLEEAGCTDADILGHCRQPGSHTRGCWVVDLILGKA